MEMTNLNVRVDKQVKREAEAVAQSLGMNLSTAVNIFLRQMIYHDGMPFEVRNQRFNAESIAAFQEAEDIVAGRKKVRRYANAEEMFADILSEEDDDAET